MIEIRSSYLKGSERRVDSKAYETDLCIVTALAAPEMRAVERIWSWEAAEPVDDVTFIRKGQFEAKGKTYSVAAAFAPRMGMVASALMSAKLISHLKPRFLVMAGICAGVSGKSDLGDIIVADPNWDWQSGKRVRDKKNSSFSIAPHQLPAPGIVRSRADQLAGNKEVWREVLDKYDGKKSGKPPQMIPGPMASGSAVLADGSVVDEIKF